MALAPGATYNPGVTDQSAWRTRPRGQFLGIQSNLPPELRGPTYGIGPAGPDPQRQSNVQGYRGPGYDWRRQAWLNNYLKSQYKRGYNVPGVPFDQDRWQEDQSEGQAFGPTTSEGRAAYEFIPGPDRYRAMGSGGFTNIRRGTDQGRAEAMLREQMAREHVLRQRRWRQAFNAGSEWDLYSLLPDQFHSSYQGMGPHPELPSPKDPVSKLEIRKAMGDTRFLNYVDRFLNSIR